MLSQKPYSVGLGTCAAAGPLPADSNPMARTAASSPSFEVLTARLPNDRTTREFKTLQEYMSAQIRSRAAVGHSCRMVTVLARGTHRR